MRLFLFSAVAMACLSCNPTSETKQKTEPTDSVTQEHVVDAHSSRTALDWSGRYEGILPCADCEGIKTVLILDETGKFTLTEEYIDRDFKNTNEGNFTWFDDGGSITFKIENDGERKFKVGENVLFSLDQDGHIITGSLADKYKLLKK